MLQAYSERLKTEKRKRLTLKQTMNGFSFDHVIMHHC